MGVVVKGPWPEFPANKREAVWPPPGWRRGGLAGLSDTEARRAEILAAKPKCMTCGVPFHPLADIPKSGLCRKCREVVPPAPDDPSLFDPDDTA